MSNWKELARSKGLKQADIIAFFFDHNDINHFTCRACKQVYSCTHCHARGYSNLFSHLERLHPAFAEVLVEILSQAECMVNLQPSHFEKLNSSRMRKAINLFRWIEWIIIHDLPFSFVESEYTRKNTSLDPISINALLLGMEKLAEKVADRIKDDLPASFGLIFDGWSQSGTHFLAVFASYYNKESKIASSKGACYPMLSLAPLLNETSFTADEHITFFGELLTLYGKSIDNVAFFVGDNCETNQCISRRLNIPLIGCAAHKLNLAVKLIFTNYNTLISKMKTAISELSTLKNRGFLRSIDALAPVSWNDTRWTSTFHALNRYVTLHPMLRDNQNTPMEVRSKLLSSEEFEQLKALQERLNILYSTSEYLQSEKCDLAHARLLLDKIVERFRFVAGVEEKIGPEGALVVDPCFESAIVKVLNEEFRTLTTTEVQKLKPFEVPIASEHQSNKRRNEAEDIIEQESERKRQKYIPLNHIPASSALVERSFSHADLIFEPRRRAMTPLHLELCLFLKFNRLLWEVEYLIEY